MICGAGEVFVLSDAGVRQEEENRKIGGNKLF